MKENKKYATIVLVGVGLFFTCAILLDPSRLEYGYPYNGYPFLKPCGFRARTGIPCPTCFLTRSIVWLIHGNPIKSIIYHPFGIVLTLVITALGIEAVFVLIADRSWKIFSRQNIPRILLILFLIFLICWTIVLVYNFPYHRL